MLDLAAIDRVLDAYLAKVDAIGIEPVQKDEPEIPEWQRLHRLMDRAEPGLRNAFLDAVAAMQSAETRRAVAAMLDSGDVEGALRLIPWDKLATQILAGPFMETYAQVFERAGTVSATMIAGVDPFDFAITDRHRVDYIERHGAELVRQITDEGRLGLRAALAKIEHDGLSPTSAAKLVMEHVGLYDRLSLAVENYRAARQLAGASESKATSDAAAYARRLHRFRGNMIASTESAFAASSGQTAAWETAVAEGRIDPGEAFQVWVTAADEIARKCPICGPMNGQEVRLGEMFTTGRGLKIAAPPAHPFCRCSRILAPAGSRHLRLLRRALVVKRARYLYELPGEWWRLAA